MLTFGNLSEENSLYYSCNFSKTLKLCQNRIFFFLTYFWLRWVFTAARGLSLVAVREGYSLSWCAGSSLWWLLLLWSTGSRCTGFSSCGTWAQQLWLTGSRAQAQQLWHTGLVAPRHVGSSWTRAQTHVPCIGRRILNHCTTREAPKYFLEELCYQMISKTLSVSVKR